MWCKFFVTLIVIHLSHGQGLIDHACKSNDDCIGFVSEEVNSTCIKDFCLCYNERNTKVICTPNEKKAIHRLGDPCPCTSIENSYCEKKLNICICNNNFISTPDYQRCIKKSVPHKAPCETDSQCVSYDRFSNCDLEGKFCSCLHNYTFANGSCRSIVGIEQTCETTNQCEENIKNSYCQDRRCICNNGFIAKTDNSLCLPVAKYGEKCEESNQCHEMLGIGAICDSHMCVCGSKYLKHTKYDGKVICARNIEIGDTCVEHNECINFGEDEQSMQCHRGHCVCDEEFEEVDKMCQKKSAATSIIGSLITILIASSIISI